MSDTGSDSGQQPNGYLPGQAAILEFEGFSTLNTNTSRPALDKNEMSICDGFMPVGKSNLRTIPGASSGVYTPSNPNQIVHFQFGNIQGVEYCILFISDGSVVALNLSTLANTTIIASGTVQFISPEDQGVTNWGAQYIIIVSGQTNGYWIWDGTVIYSVGGLAPTVEITNGGTGYTSAPSVSLSGGSGGGATFTAIVSGGSVVGVTITNPGSGYGAGDSPTVAFSGGGGSDAAATVNMMPFGISGTTVETYLSRVYVALSAFVYFTSAGSVSDFSTSSGGGFFQSTDSFLTNKWTQLQQTNGFLYLVADSSINYISNVQTSGDPPTTTFSNQNANPEVGTPFGNTCQVFSENIVFANAFGIHVSYGGKVSKISEPLDGLYASIPYQDWAIVPSSAKAIIFGKRVYMLLLPVIDQMSLAPTNKLLMWSGKVWWTSQQNVALNFIGSSELNSVLTAYGTDGNHLYPLFTQPSANFTKTVQSKLYSEPSGYMAIKQASRFWGLGINNGGSTASITLGVDNEISTSTVTLSAPASSPSTAVIVFPPQAVGQNGALLGMTLSTNHSDFTLIAAAIDAVHQDYRG